MDEGTIAKLLPEVYRDALAPGGVLDAALAVMSSFITPPESALSSLDAWFDPRRAPDDFLMLMATWVALGPYVEEAAFDSRGGRGALSIDPGNLRELVARGAAFSRQRGTRGTIVAMLEIATGITGFQAIENPPDEGGRPQPYAFRIEAPAAAKSMYDIISRVVEREKPAFATAEIVYADRQGRVEGGGP
jgi:phage tail-like protein